MPETRTISVSRTDRNDLQRLESRRDIPHYAWPVLRRIVAAWDAAPPTTSRVEIDRDDLAKVLDAWVPTRPRDLSAAINAHFRLRAALGDQP